MKKLFVTDASRTDDYGRELRVALEQVRKNDPYTVALSAEDLDIERLQLEQPDVVVSNGLNAAQHYMLRGLGIVNVVFDEKASFGPLADIVIDYKANDQIGNFGTSKFSLFDNPNFNFAEIANLVKLLPWDTNFFGFGVGYVSSRNLTENIYHKVAGFVRQHQIRLLEYLCNCHDRESVKIAEQHQFHFTDIRLTFDCKTSAQNIAALPEGYSYGLAEKRHIRALQECSADLYKDSRYYFDGNFETSKLNDFYQGWVEKAVLGTFDHLCYCIFDGDTPTGFCTIRNAANQSAIIGLVGFAPKYQGMGLGKKLLQYVIDQCHRNGQEKIYVVTQGRNYGAQRLYQGAGFKTFSTELWYHKWY
ncbi:MAG: GNAT family N-acetyltransferase [Chitinophagales bacterium]